MNDSNKIGEILISAGADINTKDIIYQSINLTIFNYKYSN